MSRIRLAGATINQTPLDWDGNHARIVALLTKARAAKVSLLCLPELAITGYGCEDLFLSPYFLEKASTMLVSLLPSTKGLAVTLGLPIYHHGATYNGVAMVRDGRILGVSAKKMLAREGIHYEPRWFAPWPKGRCEEITIGGKRVPFGDLYYDFGGVGVGLEICEEAWDKVPSCAAIADSLDIVLNPSASHFALRKYATRERLVCNTSRALKVHYVYANLLGNESGRIIYDGGVMIAAGGRMLAAGERFMFDDGSLTLADIDVALDRVEKLKNRPFQTVEHGPDSPVHKPTVVTDKPLPDVGDDAKASQPREANGVMDVNEEFLRAEMLGLFDYMRKSKAHGFIVSQSGGCDSATVALLVGHLVAEGVKQLGLTEFCRRAGIKLASKIKPTVKSLIGMLLTSVYQSTAQSSKATQASARELAEELGAEFHVADIQEHVRSFVSTTERMIGRKLTWKDDDIALQNIQARTRSPIVWLLANLKGALLLSTSNRSEVAVGYATMDGDTAGGLAPLAGIDKRFLREWLRWAETKCDIGLGPLKSLRLTNALPPSAELRPLAAGSKGVGQTDEEDLMPYVILERIERYYIRDKLGPDAIAHSLRKDAPELSAKQATVYVTKFLTLWTRSQWKRERYAPSFHLDDESLDPKTWCRYPILSFPPA